MKLFDGKMLVEIKMHMWDERKASMSPDWSNDFFDAGSLVYDTERDAYIVDDVAYCVEQANDWTDFCGDFASDEHENGIERTVFIDFIQE